jgi:hypothetical protein
MMKKILKKMIRMEFLKLTVETTTQMELIPTKEAIPEELSINNRSQHLKLIKTKPKII